MNKTLHGLASSVLN